MAHLSNSSLPAEYSKVAPDPVSAPAIPAIREQLERMLASPLFRNSKRYSSLLRYVVEKSLYGETSPLKERTLGVEVFGRPSDYDTNLDPVVRIAASEIRRRIAQYYYQPGHESEVRIDLPTGSYAPEFHLPAVKPAAPLPVAPSIESRTRLWVYVAGAALVIAFLAVALWLRPWTPRSPLDGFWGPVVKSSDPVLICVGARSSVAPSGQTGVSAVAGGGGLGLRDATMLARVAGLIEARGSTFNIRAASETTFADLRNGPVVLIGGFNNDWTMRLTTTTRFGFERSGDGFAIRDRRDSSGKTWIVKARSGEAFTPPEEDYALISRVWDPTTEGIVVVGAGLTSYGTIAASEFLTNATYMEALVRQAPSGWQSKNIQVVLATRVLNGSSGPPRLVAVHCW